MLKNKNGGTLCKVEGRYKGSISSCRYIQTVVAILTNIVKYLEEEYWGEFNILLKYLKGKGGVKLTPTI